LYKAGHLWYQPVKAFSLLCTSSPSFVHDACSSSTDDDALFPLNVNPSPMHASFAAFAIKMPVIDPLVNAAYYYHHRFHESSCFLCQKCKDHCNGENMDNEAFLV
jgi:hypothetical protein